MPKLLKLMIFWIIIFPFTITGAAVLAELLFGEKFVFIHYVPIFLGWAITGMLVGLVIYIIQKRNLIRH
jgi:hypothetical protein